MISSDLISKIKVNKHVKKTSKKESNYFLHPVCLKKQAEYDTEISNPVLKTVFLFRKLMFFLSGRIPIDGTVAQCILFILYNVHKSKVYFH